MERKEKERQKLEQERRKEREEEDALEQVGGWTVPADFRDNSQSLRECSLTALFVNQYPKITK